MITNMTYEAICNVGCVRSNNEDMAYVAGTVLRDGELAGNVDLSDGVVAFAVADGMGGYEGGEIASEIVTRSFAQFIKNLKAENGDNILTSIKDWAVSANKLVLDSAAIRTELAEMGTTFIALIWSHEKLWLVNVGDSRCYRYRQGVLKQLSVDHSERNRTGNADIPSNLIYNYMGNDPADFISDVASLKPMDGDIYLLCSDGLSDLVDFDNIEGAISSPSKLLQLALQAGGKDNVTIISVSVTKEPGSDV